LGVWVGWRGGLGGVWWWGVLGLGGGVVLVEGGLDSVFLGGVVWLLGGGVGVCGGGVFVCGLVVGGVVWGGWFVSVVTLCVALAFVCVLWPGMVDASGVVAGEAEGGCWGVVACW